MELPLDELLTKGRRDLVCGEISKAVEYLQKACEILSSKNGDVDDSLANPYLLYGTALLELVRMESSVIVPENDSESSDTDEGLIEGGPEMTNEEKEEISNQVIDAMCVDEVNKDNDGEDAAGSACEHLSDDEGEDDVAEIEGLTEETSEVGDHIEIDEHPVDETSSTKSDDVTNLQIAWEVIEVSKSIFSRHKDDQSQLNVAECLEKLGEISREKEDYEQAFADLKESLSIRLSILGNKDRGVAESYFQLGTTYAVSGNFDDANSYFRLSAECLKLHLIELEGRVTDKTVDNEQSSLLSSINEIKDLISDVQRRISDIEEDRLAEQLQPSDTQNKDPLAKNGSPACDISHLVRKKRVNCEKLQDSVVTQNGSESINGCNVSPISKKPKLSECSNVPVTNGVHE